MPGERQQDGSRELREDQAGGLEHYRDRKREVAEPARLGQEQGLLRQLVFQNDDTCHSPILSLHPIAKII